MKFCKKYEEYLRAQEKKLKLPGFQFKRLKKILKNCSRDFQTRHRHGDGDGVCSTVAVHSCPDHCSGMKTRSCTNSFVVSSSSLCIS